MGPLEGDEGGALANGIAALPTSPCEEEKLQSTTQKGVRTRTRPCRPLISDFQPPGLSEINLLFISHRLVTAAGKNWDPLWAGEDQRRVCRSVASADPAAMETANTIFPTRNHASCW